jgi:hypothetical protein
MGRGLSPLQQQILRLAWEREQPTPGRAKAQQVLFPQEIFVRVYHWKVTHNRWAPWREPSLAVARATTTSWSARIVGSGYLAGPGTRTAPAPPAATRTTRGATRHGLRSGSCIARSGMIHVSRTTLGWEVPDDHYPASHSKCLALYLAGSRARHATHPAQEIPGAAASCPQSCPDALAARGGTHRRAHRGTRAGAHRRATRARRLRARLARSAICAAMRCNPLSRIDSLACSAPSAGYAGLLLRSSPHEPS